MTHARIGIYDGSCSRWRFAIPVFIRWRSPHDRNDESHGFDSSSQLEWRSVMDRRRLRELWSALGWLIFPLVPVLLATTYHRTCNFMGPDPRDWDWAPLGDPARAALRIRLPGGGDGGPSRRTESGGRAPGFHAGRAGSRSAHGWGSCSGPGCTGSSWGWTSWQISPSPGGIGNRGSDGLHSTRRDGPPGRSVGPWASSSSGPSPTDG